MNKIGVQIVVAPSVLSLRLLDCPIPCSEGGTDAERIDENGRRCIVKAPVAQNVRRTSHRSAYAVPLSRWDNGWRGMGAVRLEGIS
jgi:hypothetical protein